MASHGSRPEFAQLASSVAGSLQTTIMTPPGPSTVIQESLPVGACLPPLLSSVASASWSPPYGLPLGPDAGPPTRQHPGRRPHFAAAATTSSSGLGGGHGLAQPPWLVDVPSTSTVLGPMVCPGPGRTPRSRSPLRPLRADAPGRRQRSHGTMPDLRTEGAQAAALAEFRMAIYAESSRASLSFKWRTVERMLAAWGVEPFPPTPTRSPCWVLPCGLVGTAVPQGTSASTARPRQGMVSLRARRWPLHTGTLLGHAYVALGRRSRPRLSH